MFIKKYEATTHIIYKIFGIKFKLKKELNNKILLINSSQDIIEIKKIKGLDIKFKGANNRIIFNEQIPIFKNSKSSDSNELNAKEGSYEDKRKTHIQS